MADAEKTDKTDAADAPKPKKKSKLVPLLLALALVLLAGGGAAGYWMYSTRTGEQGQAEPDAPDPGVVKMDPFVVNLADEGGNRFLRVNMTLLTWDEDQAAELSEAPVAAARVRSAILELLSLQYAAPLITHEGKEELKKAIAERATEALGHGEGHDMQVTDVLFSEFVVQ
jgi:flagellar FliL protein